MSKRFRCVLVGSTAMTMAAAFISAPASAGLIDTVYGATSNGFLARWQANTPGQFDSSVFISGLQANETVVGLDFRPLNGQLFAIGSSSRTYTINLTTGLATQVGGVAATQINGSHFGFDFNPTIDRARLVSNTNQNLVFNPNDGTTAAPATNLFYGPADPNFGIDPNIVHNAYSNSTFGGSATTVQYAMDSGLDVLTTLANNAGTLGTVGSLGINIDATGGFDISGASGIAYAALLESGDSASGFYTISLATGSATLVGELGGGVVITAMSVQIIPGPASMALLAVAGLVTSRRRRR